MEALGSIMSYISMLVQEVRKLAKANLDRCEEHRSAERNAIFSRKRRDKPSVWSNHKSYQHLSPEELTELLTEDESYELHMTGVQSRDELVANRLFTATSYTQEVMMWVSTEDLIAII
jgi:hypothetical protein